jgi:hypothetical protein
MKLRTFVYGEQDVSESRCKPSRRLVVMFGASSLVDNPEAIQHVVRAYPSEAVVGCSTSGEIFGSQIKDDTLVAAVVDFDRTTVRSVCAPVVSAGESGEAGASIARQLAAPDLKAVLVLSN